MEIVDFYLGRRADHAGRGIEEIWAFDAGALEHHHDFIQWLFPLEVPSPVNPEAPVLDAETMAAFRASAELRGRMVRSLKVMLRFYGFVRRERDGRVMVEGGTGFEKKAEHLLRPGKHKHLRITRILR
jgi:hypothetical protein